MTEEGLSLFYSFLEITASTGLRTGMKGDCCLHVGASIVAWSPLHTHHPNEFLQHFGVAKVAKDHWDSNCIKTASCHCLVLPYSQMNTTLARTYGFREALLGVVFREVCLKIFHKPWCTLIPSGFKEVLHYHFPFLDTSASCLWRCALSGEQWCFGLLTKL